MFTSNLYPVLADSIYNDNWPFESTLKDQYYNTTSVRRFDLDEGFGYAIDMPGVSENDITIAFKNSALHIKAESPENQPDARSYNFSFALSKEADSDSIKAQYVNGVLKLAVFKKETEKAKSIKVSSKDDSGFWANLLPKAN